MTVQFSRTGRKRPKSSPRTRKRRGAAIVEFAVVGIMFIFLILAAIEISRGIMVNEVLNNAARSGCRVGCQYGSTNTDIIAEVNNYLSDNGLNVEASGVSIAVNGNASADVAAAKRHDKITVTVTMPVSQVYWTTTLFLNESIQLSETVVMMRQK